MATIPRSRKPRLTPDVARRIVEALEAGATQAAAAESAGLGRSTFYRYLQEADVPGARRELRDFRDAVTRARATAETSMVAAILQDVRGGYVVEEATIRHRDGSIETRVRRTAPNGRLALEFLSRTRPQDYRKQVAVTGGDGGAVQVEVSLAGVAERVAQVIAERQEDELLFPTVPALEA